MPCKYSYSSWGGGEGRERKRVLACTEKCHVVKMSHCKEITLIPTDLFVNSVKTQIRIQGEFLVQIINNRQGYVNGVIHQML